ncbi:RNA polymerase sigma factor [Streptomyces sp. CA-288835]|uniref:RNA polymerase sigma factor n=1 Tax=Streptomyces sp. CA-288835 TaxID=3240069 RepID=UPI003D8C798F
MSTQANPKISPPGGATTELVDRAHAGDREAFATLYNDHYSTVYRFLFSRTRDRHLAEDLTQEVFVRALRRIDTFDRRRTGGGFGAWLSVIARNLHLDHLKLHRVQREFPVAELHDSHTRDRSAESSALRELDIAEAKETVAAAMQVLNPYQRQCVRLRFLEELSVPETASRMGKGVGAVKTLQFRSLRLMEQALTSEEAAA